MNYEERYKEALDLMKDCVPDENGLVHVHPEDIFPELRESEDEKIRKELIEKVKETPACIGFNDKNAVLAWLEKQGEKNPADKIAPKFHEGDWIISNNKKSIYQVIEVKRGIYVVRDNADNHEYHIGIEECEKSGRLWTIQDAKDDDVLVHNGITFIFKGIEDGIVKGLCSELSDSILNFGEPEHDKDYYPATKEQRYFLFQKMKEAGYEWDVEKKELKKIENRPMLSDFFNAEYERGKADALKSVECSEEDEKNLVQCIEAIDACYEWDSMIDWLKSLRSRSRWKPSEEQMRALHDMNLTGNISYAGQGQILIELYNDLKKL